MPSTEKGYVHADRAAARTRRRRLAREGRRPRHGGLAIPISAVYRDLDGRLRHQHCGARLSLERREESEAVFRCLQCFEQVYVPLVTLPRIPTGPRSLRPAHLAQVQATSDR